MAEIKLSECTLLMLVKVPNGDIHQVYFNQTELKDFVLGRDRFVISEDVVLGIDFNLKDNDGNK